MRDFTLYLHDLDAQSFSASNSRHGMKSFQEEWKAAWDEYDEHVLRRLSEAEGDSLAIYAKSSWRQDPRNINAIKGREIYRINFSLEMGRGNVNIYNDTTGRWLDFCYGDVVSVDWRCSTDPSIGVGRPALRFEELRFISGAVEHEIVFFGGRLIVLAGFGSVNIDSYLV